MTRCMIAGTESPPNGETLFAANAMVQPHANMSSGGPPAVPANCSGAM